VTAAADSTGSTGSSGEAVRRPYAPRLPPEQRREQLLDAALGIFNQAGLAAVTVDAVARAAGVTRPVVYGQFTDSADLLRELLTREERRALDQINAVLAASATEHPVHALANTTRGFLTAVLAHPATWRAILLPVDGVPAPVRRHKERTEQAIRDRIAAVIRRHLDGYQRADGVDVDLLAHSVLRLLEEGGRLVLDHPEEYPVDRLVRFAQGMASTFHLRYS
jgi:AcrR family transcriptional regulator